MDLIPHPALSKPPEWAMGVAAKTGDVPERNLSVTLANKMKPDFFFVRTLKILATFTAVLLSLYAAPAQNSLRERWLMDTGWKFHLGNDWGSALDLMKAGADFGPAQPAFNDVTWRNLDLPHDWVVELPFDQNAETYHGYKPSGAGSGSSSAASIATAPSLSTVIPSAARKAATTASVTTSPITSIMAPPIRL